MIIYARKRMIFHVFDANLVLNSEVSNLSLTLTAYNFFFQIIFGHMYNICTFGKKI